MKNQFLLKVKGVGYLEIKRLNVLTTQTPQRTVFCLPIDYEFQFENKPP